MPEIRIAEHDGHIFIVRLAITPRQIHLVKACFPAVAKNAEALSDVFYDQLFAARPSIRALFPKDIGAQKNKLIKTLGYTVGNLHKPTTIFPQICELGRRHLSYEVRPEHYAYVRDALLRSLHKILGAEFTNELREAWLAVYRMIAQVMQGAGQIPRDAQGFYPGIVKSVLDGVYGVDDYADRDRQVIRLDEHPKKWHA